MSETKWTPGPWNGRDIKISDQEGAGISICFTYPPRDEYRANTHLIASAPELYEALDSIVRSAEENNAAINMPLIAAAKTALAKARGEQP